MPHFLSGLYERLGLNAYIQGDPKKALAWFRKLETVEPDSIRVLRNIGVILLSSGDAAGAEEYLLREERLYGESLHRHSALADLAFARGRREDAAKRYASALADPDLAPAGGRSSQRGFIEKRLKICKDSEAFEAATRAAAVFTQAESARDSGDNDLALALFEEAAMLDPTHWPALNNAGTLALNVIGDAVRAQTLFERAFDLAQSAQVARNVELARDWLAKEALAQRSAVRKHERKSR